MAHSLSQFSNIFRDGLGGEPLKALKALTSLNKCGGGSVCHPSFVRTINNGILHSECNRQAWSPYDLKNEKGHMAHFIVNRFGKFQKAVRVLYIILEFSRKLFVKVRPNQ